jgi:transposase-like protein
MNEPKTLQQAIVYFSDPERAFAYAIKFRWPDGKITCPRCGSDKNSFVKTRKLWFCYGCKKQFTLKVRTIFEDSPLGLDKWMAVFWMLANCKNGISSYELAKALGIHQGSAWFMLQRIREVMKQDKFGKSKIGGGPGGTVEVDETFVGGETANMHKDRRVKAEGKGPYKNKTIVHGILDRDLRQVRATVVPSVTRETLQAEILKQVKFGSTVYTDNAVAYDSGLQRRFVHDIVNKTEAYVQGLVHVNGMENFWTLLKRSLRGTYVAVEPFHLSRYVDEQAFRYNHRKDGDRKLTDADRFAIAMRLIVGKRLTYADLTRKSDSPHHETTGTGQTEVPF